MGRFKAIEKFNKLEWGTIYFRDRESLQVWNRNTRTLTTFNNYYPTRGSYPRWKKFRDLCKRNKSTPEEIYIKAGSLNIDHRSDILRSPPEWAITWRDYKQMALFNLDDYKIKLIDVIRRKNEYL